jgi:hypothetical protein
MKCERGYVISALKIGYHTRPSVEEVTVRVLAFLLLSVHLVPINFLLRLPVLAESLLLGNGRNFNTKMAESPKYCRASSSLRERRHRFHSLCTPNGSRASLMAIRSRSSISVTSLAIRKAASFRNAVTSCQRTENSNHVNIGIPQSWESICFPLVRIPALASRSSALPIWSCQSLTPWKIVGWSRKYMAEGCRSRTDQTRG